MTRERIEDMREVVLPFVKKRLLETNYEGLGKSDAKEFEREFNEILNLAIKALEQESVLDKIRAEIRANSIYVMPQYGRTIREADVLRIIDKHKAESEEND